LAFGPPARRVALLLKKILDPSLVMLRGYQSE
jgi:hypothetical protein